MINLIYFILLTIDFSVSNFVCVNFFSFFTLNAVVVDDCGCNSSDICEYYN